MFNNHILRSSFKDGLYRFQLDNGKVFSATGWNDAVMKARKLASHYGYKIADLTYSVKEAIVELNQQKLNQFYASVQGKAVMDFYRHAMS